MVATNGARLRAALVKKLGNFVAEKRVRTLKASQEESILVTMSVVQPKS